MDPVRLLLRAKRLAQHPPPMWKVKLMLGIVAACVALYAVEQTVGLPDWMSITPARQPRLN